MQPYVPFIVIEALAEERSRELSGFKHEPMYQPGPVVRRRLGAVLVRFGGWLQGPLPEPTPRPA